MHRPIRILLVDDEKDFVEMLSLILQDRGDSVTPAYNGLQCLEELARADFDVVLLDVKMPGLNGIDTLREIKKRFPLVEVILLTGDATRYQAVTGMNLGAYDFLLKPTDYDELLAKLEGARAKKGQQELRIRKAKKELLK